MLDFVALDFETANKFKNSACSLAVITVKDGQITKKAYSLIKPPFKRDNQSYGFMSLTPTGRDTDQLKNCVITYYRTPKDKNQLEEISINHVKLANLKLQDFQTRKLIDIFEVNPADYNVSDKDNNQL